MSPPEVLNNLAPAQTIELSPFAQNLLPQPEFPSPINFNPIEEISVPSLSEPTIGQLNLLPEYNFEINIIEEISLPSHISNDKVLEIDKDQQAFDFLTEIKPAEIKNELPKVKYNNQSSLITPLFGSIATFEVIKDLKLASIIKSDLETADLPNETKSIFGSILKNFNQEKIKLINQPEDEIQSSSSENNLDLDYKTQISPRPAQMVEVKISNNLSTNLNEKTQPQLKSDNNDNYYTDISLPKVDLKEPDIKFLLGSERLLVDMTEIEKWIVAHEVHSRRLTIVKGILNNSEQVWPQELEKAVRASDCMVRDEFRKYILLGRLKLPTIADQIDKTPSLLSISQAVDRVDQAQNSNPAKKKVLSQKESVLTPDKDQIKKSDLRIKFPSQMNNTPEI